MSNLFKVAAFRITDNWIEVDIQNITTKIDTRELEIEVKIKLKKFNDWLIFDERMEWEMNYSNHLGEHVQTDGRMSFEEYQMLNEEQIFQDLYDYITTHEITYRNQVKVNATESILNAFKNY